MVGSCGPFSDFIFSGLIGLLSENSFLTSMFDSKCVKTTIIKSDFYFNFFSIITVDELQLDLNLK